MLSKCLAIYRKNKRAISTYFIVVISMIAILLPAYIDIYSLTKKNLNDGFKHNLEVGMNLFDTDVENILKLCLKISSDYDYSLLQQTRDDLTLGHYSTIRNFSSFYKNVTGTNNIIENSYLVFKNNSLCFSKDYVFDDASKFSNFRSYISYKDMEFDSFKKMVFSGEHPRMMIYDSDILIDGQKSPSILYFVSVTNNALSESEAALVNIISLDTFLKAFSAQDSNLSGIDVALLDSSGNVMYKSSDRFNSESDNVIKISSRKEGISVNISIPGFYYGEQIKSFRMFIWVYVMVVFLIGCIIAFWLYLIQSKPLRKLVHLTENITGEKELTLKGYDFIYNVVKKINNNNVYLKDMISKDYFERIFLPEISKESADIFLEYYPDFPQPCVMALFKSEVHTFETYQLLVEKSGIEKSVLANDPIGNVCMFTGCFGDVPDIDYINRLNVIIEMSKESGIALNIYVTDVIDNVFDIYRAYNSVLEKMRMCDSNGVINVPTRDRSSAADAYDTIYEIVEPDDRNRMAKCILSHNAFEAKKIIYKQWYELSQKPVASGKIEQLYIYQTGILRSVADKVGYTGVFPVYDNEKHINNLAFDMADLIDSMCVFIVQQKNNSAFYNDVIDYIDEHLTEVGFGLIDLKDKFNISSKTVSKIVKQKTAMKFSDYVEIGRIKKAKQLLERTDMVIYDIAAQCGYGTNDAFYKAFNRREGMSPGAYRQQMNSEK